MNKQLFYRCLFLVLFCLFVFNSCQDDASTFEGRWAFEDSHGNFENIEIDLYETGVFSLKGFGDSLLNKWEVNPENHSIIFYGFLCNYDLSECDDYIGEYEIINKDKVKIVNVDEAELSFTLHRIE